MQPAVIKSATVENWLAPSYGANFIQGCKSVASSATSVIEGATDDDGKFTGTILQGKFHSGL